MAKAEKPKSPHAGHRQRLRQRLLETEGAGLADYEVLEYLLFQAYPRGDTKPKAKELIAKFGDLGGVLNSSADALKEAKLSESAIGALKIVDVATRKLAKTQILSKPILSSWDRLIDWCHVTLGHLDTEEFHLLFLDKKNVLLAHERQNRGTVDHTPVYVREVVKSALKHNATSIIMVHNHPSGNPSPSKADILMTNKVEEAVKKIGIQLHDHIIIGKSGHTSFKTAGIL